MTIYLYSGTPGTGKSLHAANDVRFALNRRMRPVIGNFEIAPDAPVRHPDNFRYVPNAQLTPKLLTDFADGFWDAFGWDEFREDYITLVLDECQLLFNSREWSANDRLAWLEFFSQHRKYGYKVIFIAQSSKMVDNQFRMLIEYEVNHRKVANMGIIGDILGLLTFGRLFCQVSYYFQMNERLGASWYLARGADMRMYDTHKRFERTA